jgi:hypothetical protein
MALPIARYFLPRLHQQHNILVVGAANAHAYLNTNSGEILSGNAEAQKSIITISFNIYMITQGLYSSDSSASFSVALIFAMIFRMLK